MAAVFKLPMMAGYLGTACRAFHAQTPLPRDLECRRIHTGEVVISEQFTAARLWLPQGPN
jgi:hypothetical protein